jgi:uncharacterized DUF497 family protein
VLSIRISQFEIRNSRRPPGLDVKHCGRRIPKAHAQCEQIFFNRPLVIRPDTPHSRHETRYFALGRTDAGRLLFAAFTIRATLIRPISVRDMTRKEKLIHERFSQKNPDLPK